LQITKAHVKAQKDHTKEHLRWT